MAERLLRLLIPRGKTLLIEDIKSAFKAENASIGSHRTLELEHSTPTCSCLEISLNQNSIWTKESAKTLSDTLNIDILSPHPIKLAAFDMDSTVIQIEVIDELARAHHVYDEVSAITDRVVGGEISFKEGFRKRMALLKGLSTDCLNAIGASIPYTPGAKALFSALKTQGVKTLLISGGFLYFASIVQTTLGIDEIYANTLDIEDELITGEVTSDIVGSQEKATYLKTICKEDKFPLSQTLAVGDGANDIPMAKAAGISVGFHPKPALAQHVHYVLHHVGLDGLIYLINQT